MIRLRTRKSEANVRIPGGYSLTSAPWARTSLNSAAFDFGYTPSIAVPSTPTTVPPERMAASIAAASQPSARPDTTTPPPLATSAPRRAAERTP